MPASNGPFLVIRRDNGYGEVFPLQKGQLFTMGRAHTNRVVLKDELCSREHAEVFHAEGKWRLRDLKSLNGTRLNGADAPVPINAPIPLHHGDRIHVGVWTTITLTYEP